MMVSWFAFVFSPRFVGEVANRNVEHQQHWEVLQDPRRKGTTLSWMYRPDDRECSWGKALDCLDLSHNVSETTGCSFKAEGLACVLHADTHSWTFCPLHPGVGCVLGIYQMDVTCKPFPWPIPPSSNVLAFLTLLQKILQRNCVLLRPRGFFPSTPLLPPVLGSRGDSTHNLCDCGCSHHKDLNRIWQGLEMSLCSVSVQGKRRDVYWDFISLKMNRMSVLQEVSTVRSHNSKTGALTRQVMSFLVSFHFKSSCLWENTPAFTLWFYSIE